MMMVAENFVTRVQDGKSKWSQSSVTLLRGGAGTMAHTTPSLITNRAHDRSAVARLDFMKVSVPLEL